MSAAATACSSGCLPLTPHHPQVFCDACDGTCHGLGGVHARYALEPAALPPPCEEDGFGGPNGDALGALGRVRATRGRVGVTTGCAGRLTPTWRVLNPQHAFRLGAGPTPSPTGREPPRGGWPALHPVPRTSLGGTSLGGSLSSTHEWLVAAGGALGRSPGLGDEAARLLATSLQGSGAALLPGAASLGASGSLPRSAAWLAAGSPGTGRKWALSRCEGGDPALQRLLLPHHWRNVSSDAAQPPGTAAGTARHHHPGDGQLQAQQQLASVCEQRVSPGGGGHHDGAHRPGPGDDDSDSEGVFHVDDDEDGWRTGGGGDAWETGQQGAMVGDEPQGLHLDDPASRAAHEAGLALGQMVLQPRAKALQPAQLLGGAAFGVHGPPPACRAPRTGGSGLLTPRTTAPGAGGLEEDGGSDNGGGSSSGGSLARRTASGGGSPVSALPSAALRLPGEPLAAMAAAGAQAHVLARSVAPSNSAAVASAAARAAEAASEIAAGTLGRRCVHCGSNKTPQWRAGPVGAKTLCNACGVRYKNGRLQPICAFPPFGPMTTTSGEADAQQHSRPSSMLSPAKRAACSTDVSTDDDVDYRFTPMQHAGTALLAPVMTGTVPKRPRGSGGHPAPAAFVALTT